MRLPGILVVLGLLMLAAACRAAPAVVPAATMLALPAGTDPVQQGQAVILRKAARLRRALPDMPPGMRLNMLPGGQALLLPPRGFRLDLRKPDSPAAAWRVVLVPAASQDNPAPRAALVEGETGRAPAPQASTMPDTGSGGAGNQDATGGPGPAPRDARATAGEAGSADQSAPAGPLGPGGKAGMPPVLPYPRDPAAPPAGVHPDAPATARLLPAGDEAAPGWQIDLPVGTPAAAFTRHGQFHVVFATQVPLDLSALAATEMATQQTALADGVLLSMAARPPLHLRQRGASWVISAASETRPAGPLMGPAQGGVLTLQTQDAAGVIACPDPAGGGILLVGVMRKPGAAVLARRSFAEFTLLPAALGAVLLPKTPRAAMQAGRAGFVIAAQRGPALAITDQAAGTSLLPGAAFSRALDLPDLPIPELRQRLMLANQDVAAAPSLARASARMVQAQALLSLGMAREALAVLDLRDQESPAAQDDTGLLRLAASGFAAPGPDPPRAPAPPTPSDEAAFWTAFRDCEGTRQGCQALRWLWPLAITYPLPLRQALQKRLARIFGQAGDGDSLTALLQAWPDDPASAAPRSCAAGRAAELAGRADQAITFYDRCATGRDRQDAARALPALLQLQRQAKMIAPAQELRALERGLYAWRDAAVEPALRERLADAYAAQGNWRQALEVLREGEALYPSAASGLRASQQRIAAALAQGGGQGLPDFALVALLDDFADLFAALPPAGAAGPAQGQPPAPPGTPVPASPPVAGLLLDRLAALDLPARQSAILRRMLQAAHDPLLRADLARRLAETTLASGDPALALRMLDESEMPGLPPDLASHRLLLRARCLDAGKQTAAALSLLRGQNDPGALDLRARLAEAAGAWREAAAALAQQLAALQPPVGNRDAAGSGIVLRLAAALAQAGDIAGLIRLRAAELPRLPAGAQSALFRLVTATPVKNTRDLPRAVDELAAARAADASFSPAARP